MKTLKRIFLLISCFLSANGTMFAQKEIALYDGPIPNSKPTRNRERAAYEGDSIWTIHDITQPSLRFYFPPKGKASDIAVIICPGGGYSVVCAKHEGYDIAERFVASGITAIVLKYRLPNDSTMINKEIGPLQDAQQAIMVVRSRAKEWGIDPNKIGIMGFSAGGHLASTAGTHFEKGYISNPQHISLRPDFMILVYPVISFDSHYGHSGSEHNLLGPNPSPEKIIEYSNELHVSENTPPAFLVHARDDDGVPIKNSEEFASALKNHQVPVDIYFYDHGGHGFGMKNKTSSVQWMDLCADWVKKIKNKK